MRKLLQKSKDFLLLLLRKDFLTMTFLLRTFSNFFDDLKQAQITHSQTNYQQKSKDFPLLLM
jgi:hypothetical protein